jgi:hypothetical protein
MAPSIALSPRRRYGHAASIPRLNPLSLMGEGKHSVRNARVRMFIIIVILKELQRLKDLN